MIARISVVVFAVLCASCSAPTKPSSDDAALAARLVGGWTQQGLVTGAAFSMQLAATGSALSGTGHYAIEAGRSGSLAVTGHVTDGSVHIDFLYDSGLQAQFDGTLVDDHTLSGAMHTGPPQSLTPSVMVVFVRG